MIFRSSFVQYPKPVTYLVMVFDIIMIVMFLFFSLLCVLAIAFPLGFVLLPFAFLSLIPIPGLVIDLFSLGQSGLAIDKKAIVERYGKTKKIELSSIELVDCHVLLPLCHYVRLNRSIVVEISKQDREALMRNFRPLKKISVPFLSISEFAPR
jgi:hypothetical protein